MTQLPLTEQLKALEHLQELDLKIDQLKKTKDSLPTALKTLDDQLNKAKAGVNAKRNALAEIEKVQRQTRAALDLNRDRLARSTGRQDGVKNTQEFQAVNKEIEQLRKLSTSLEEQSKKSDTDISSVNTEIGTLGEHVQKLQTERETQATVLGNQGDELQKQITELTGERAQYSSKVEKRILNQYDRVRQNRGGIGIVPAIAGRCKGCNMMVPAQLFNQIRRGDAIYDCPSCHRILFVPVQTGEVNAGATGAGSNG